MMRSSLAALLAIIPLSVYSHEQSVLLRADGSGNLTAQQCCNGLKDVLTPSKILFPGSPQYTAQEATYYSGEQASQHPACRVAPTDANDVSQIVKFATQHKCEFAVRAGGHMNWVGSSNIGANGFTIDLEELKQIELLDSSKTVSMGSGLRWSDVYNFLGPHNLTTAGGRSSGVGVGGFLLGGGVSFLSLEFGFGSDNVIDYEVVLSDGSIVHANEAERPDLYWALKGGSTNYGIVTRFDMPTFPLGQMWGGSLFYNISLGLPLFKYLVAFTDRLKEDPHGMSAFSLAWSPAMNDYAIWSPNVYLQPKAFPSPLFDGLQDFEPFQNTMRITDLVDITNEVQTSSPGGSRTQWFSLVFKANAQLPWDIHVKGAEIFGPYLSRPGTSWALTLQPINVGMIAAGARNGGNPFGLSVEDGDQFLLLVSTFWTNPDDDVLMKEKTQELIRWSSDTARERGLLNRFIYLNYALNTQPVLESFGEENVKRMKEVKDKYDPENLFELWKGGYKL